MIEHDVCIMTWCVCVCVQGNNHKPLVLCQILYLTLEICLPRRQYAPGALTLIMLAHAELTLKFCQLFISFHICGFLCFSSGTWGSGCMTDLPHN